MQTKRPFPLRYIALAGLFVLICMVYIARLVNVQITGQDYYSAMLSVSDTNTRTVKIAAHRGCIYDRNGTPLVVNRAFYDLTLDYGALDGDNDLTNAAVLAVLDMNGGQSGDTDVLRTPETALTGTFPDYAFDSVYLADEGGAAKYARYLRLLAYDDDITAAELTKRVLYYYGLTDRAGEPLYTPEEIDILLAYRWDMTLDGFASNSPYVIMTELTMPVMTAAAEKSVRGLRVTSRTEREYTHPGVASHILGRVGKIQASSMQYYTELGYPMDAVVGIGGAEAAFEEYLRGVDGELVIVEDDYGNVLDSYVSVEPKAGKNVWLTIDIELQIAAEEALAANIAYIVEQGENADEPLSGEDADAGAITAASPTTGEIYAVASYPTFDLSTFSEDYAVLSADPVSPMLNRALFGQYPPGSTFKLATAAAALSEDVVEPSTIINTKGIYRFYESAGFTPRCWIYLNHGLSHGPINITQAIQVSCNYFFFEIGRLLGIDKLNEYCKKLGLGEHTGIELAESTGVLAGPEFRENGGGEEWAPGDTLQAAIGQSDNLFTPMQITAYMGALVNGGDRMGCHILYRVTDFYTEEPSLTVSPEKLGEIRLTSENYDTLMNAMKSVTENGSAARVFSAYPITVGGKTGTAQVGENRSDNAIFTAFAPFDSPRIVATCVIEKGANGTDAGFAVKGVFDAFFGLNN